MSRTKGSSLLYTSAYSQEFAPGELWQKSKTKRTGNINNSPFIYFGLI